MLYRNQYYTLAEVNGEYFLLPYGQAVEDFSAGCSVSEETAVLWKLLEETDDPDRLTRRFCEEYSLKEYEFSEIRALVSDALHQMKSLGVLSDGFTVTVTDPVSFCISVAGTVIELCGPEELFHRSLSLFRTDPADADLSFCATYRSPLPRKNGTVIMRNDEMILVDAGTEYIVLFPGTPELKEASISKDMKKTAVYCGPSVTDEGREIILNILRYVYLTHAASQDRYAVHSVSVLHNGKAWLFSGPSGTGKTTHAEIWKKLYGSEIFNGDLNLIGYENGIPTVFGTPWCGSSGICSTGSVPLGGIVLLQQCPENRVEHPDRNSRILLLSQRLINMHTEGRQVTDALRFLAGITEDIHVFRLFCNMEDEAAEVCRKEIDRYGGTQ